MRRKRSYVAGVVAAAAALAAVAATVALAAAGDPVQTLEASTSPSKLPGDDLAPAKITVVTETYWEGADGQEDTTRIPPHANRAVIFLADNNEFDTSEAKKCNADIENMSTDDARAACKKAQVGTGSATASLPLGPGGARVDVEAVVTAFNGPTQQAAATRAAGNPTILLHAYIASLNTTTVLTGVLLNATGKYGNKLDVDIPPLAGGLGAIRDFLVAVKHGAYVQGTCPKKDRTLDYKGVFYTSDAGRLTATDTQRCKTKK